MSSSDYESHSSSDSSSESSSNSYISESDVDDNYENTKKKSKPTQPTTPKCRRTKLVAQEKNAASATKADVKTKTKRTKRLTKNEIREICDHLDSNRDLLMDYMKKSVLEIKSKHSYDMTTIINHDLFAKLIWNITSDFTTAYNEKGYAKYENFLMTLFNGLKTYLFDMGEKRDLVYSLFDKQCDKDLVTDLFPTIYHTVCNVLHQEIIKYLASR